MRLETERLILRKPKLSDWEDILEACKDISISRMTTIPHPYKKKDAIDFIRDCQKRWRKKDKTDFPFVIELKSEKKVIGNISITKFNKKFNICETGSWMNKSYRRKSYITEAKIAVNDFAFNKLKVRKMETSVIGKNKASNATQKAMGYKYEGTRIKHFVNSTGKIDDLHLYGLMKKEWKKVRPKIKKKLNEKIKGLGEGKR